MPWTQSLATPRVEAPAATRLRLTTGNSLSLLSLLVATADLIGWLCHIPLLTSVLPGYATMKPNTAICLGLLALASLLLQPAEPSRLHRLHGARRPIFAGLAGLAALLSAGTLIEYTTHWQLPLDRLFLPVAADAFVGPPGRMTLGTGVCVLLVAVAILVLDRLPRTSTVLLVVSGGITLSAIIGFCFNAGPLYGVRWLNSIAVHTAVTLLLLQVAVLSARPEREPFHSLLQHSAHSGRMRWLFVGVTVVPAILAFPLLAGMRIGLIDPPFAFALLVVLLIGVQTTILWQDSMALSQAESQRQMAEQALLQSEKLAVAGRLAASISHEINNPLESIGNLLYLVRNAESLQAASPYVLLAEQELNRVAQITTQTLTFHRDTRNLSICAAENIVRSALKLLAPKIAASAMTVTLDLQPSEAKIYCKEGEMRQVIVNLISNALEATPAGGRLMVRVHASQRWGSHAIVTDAESLGVRIVVADTGSGIPLHLQQRIFDPFFTTKADTGNGLGLWVARDLVESHGGFIHVHSSTRPSASGTAFCVFLPFISQTPDSRSCAA
jgi:signal transduction histidine kinase